MKISLSLALLSCAIPILSAPVPTSQTTPQECILFGCRSSYRNLLSSWGPRTSHGPKNHKVPEHHSVPSPTHFRITQGDGQIIEVPAKSPVQHHSVPDSWLAGVNRKIPGTDLTHSNNAAMLAKLQEEDAKRFGYAAFKAMKGGCHKAARYTYTVGYTYVQKDYKDILVVGLVVVFLLAVVLVEVFESVVET